MSSTTAPNMIDRLVKRAQRLYSLPAVAMKVVDLTSEPKIDTAALRDCIENDPALTAKILRVVNSSLFGLSGQVDDLNQAITLLGTKPLKLLVLGFSLPDELLSGLEASVLERYWRHTLIKACAARQIANQLLNASGDDAFLAGLLQEIGILALIQDLGEPYLQFLDGVAREGADVASLEISTLGFDHTILSARMLTHWGLPQTLVDAVASPHDELKILEMEEATRAIPQALHLAERIARFLSSNRPELLDEILNAGRLYCELTMDQLEVLIGTLQEHVDQLAEILSLNLPGDADYASVLVLAHHQLSSMAEEVSTSLATEDNTDFIERANELSKCVERMADQPELADLLSGEVASSPATAAQSAREEIDLAHDPGFTAHVRAAVSACRQARSSISLMLVELDNFSSQLMTRGVKKAEQTVKRLRQVIEESHGGDGKVLIISDVRFALILPKFERQPAVEVARQLVHNVRQWSLEDDQWRMAAISVSAGIATLGMPPNNFPEAELIQAAERCLSGAQYSGGDSVKSIDIY